MVVGPLGRLAPFAISTLTFPFSTFLDAERLRQERIDAFTAGGGLKLSGSPAQQEWLMKHLKHAMLKSPSFSDLMFEIQADEKHPVDVKMVNRQPDVFVDGFNSRYTLGVQEIDLDDLSHLPADPPRAFPDAVTRGEILAHAMAEAREGALGIDGERDEYRHAHEKAITVQNAYRDDLGQKGHRRPPPDDGGRNSAGNFEMRYDNGYSEVWVKGDGAQSIHHVDRSAPASRGASYDAAGDLKSSMEDVSGPR